MRWLNYNLTSFTKHRINKLNLKVLKVEKKIPIEGSLHDDVVRADPREPEDQRARVQRDGPGRHRAEDDHHQVLASHKTR